MPLPLPTLPTSSVTIDGQEITFRALSRQEAIDLNQYQGRPDEAEVYVLMKATGCTEEEAQAFRGAGTVEQTSPLIDGILILSGLAIRLRDGTVVGKATKALVDELESDDAEPVPNS